MDTVYCKNQDLNRGAAALRESTKTRGSGKGGRWLHAMAIAGMLLPAAQVHADNTAIGLNAWISADATNAVAVGADSSVTASSGTAIGQGSSVTAEGAVAIGQGAVADQVNTVSMGNVGNERMITNVAAGTSPTAATNVGQMMAADQATLSSANAYTDMRFHSVDRRIDRLGAMSVAMMNMATSAAGVDTSNRIGVGVGFQGGVSALSVGYQRAISKHAVLSIGGAFSGGEKAVGIGAGFGW